jgi:hypothetical protein
MVTTYAKGPVRDALIALKNKLGIGVRVFLNTLIPAPMTLTADACLIGYPLAKTVATTQKIKDTPTTAEGESVFGLNGFLTRLPFCGTLLRLLGGITRPLIWTASTSIKATCRAICVLYPWGKTEATTKEPLKKCNNELMTLRPVFDILNSGSRNRFTVLTNRGPLIVHNCAYEGGVGAFATFAGAYSVDLDELAQKVLPLAPKALVDKADKFLEWVIKDKRPRYGLSDDAFVACDVIKRAWRDAHPNITGYWGRLKNVVMQALNTRGTTYTTLGLKIRATKGYLLLGLPSGRSLCYPLPKIVDEGITYMGVDQFTRKWTRIPTHGGKLFENLCQAIARDVMAANMPLIEAAGYTIILTVHDEIIAEAPDTAQYNVDHMAALLATPPSWALDMPLAAAGFETYRYRKE